MTATSPYDELTPESIKASMLSDLTAKGVDVSIREGSYANTLVSVAAYDINFRQAVLRLDLDFGLGLSQAPQRSRAEQSAILEARRREAERRAVFEREYHEKTVEHRYWWEVLKYFAPTKEDAAAGFIHPLYAEALRRQPYLEYWLEENLGKGVIT